MIATIITVFIIVALIAAGITLAINIAVCAIHYSCLSRIPTEYRKMEPWKVWLLMIPVFNLFWNFIVCQSISESYHAYFTANGVTDVGDCGKKLGLWYCICTVGPFVIPCVGSLVGMAALVLMIIFIVKEFELRGKIPRDAAA